MNKGQKLVKMVELIGRPGGVSANELAQRFELDPRTFRRYLQDLRDIQIPFRDEGRGHRRRLQMDPGYRRVGITLSLTEVLSLHFGRTLFNFLEGTSFASDMDDALERLGPVIRDHDADIARSLDQRFLAVGEQSKDYSGEHSEVLDELITSLVYNQAIDARYRKPNGLEKAYVLEPYTLVTYRQALYIFARDTRADQVKTFAVDRFSSVERLRDRRFALPDDWDPAERTRHAFGIISGPPEHVRVAFAPALAGIIRERKWHASQSFGTTPDGWVELSMHVALSPELITWILGYGANARVLEPPALVDRVREHVRRMNATYGLPA